VIAAIGEWALDTACWRVALRDALMPDLRMSVNVSPHLLTQGSFVEVVRAALVRCGRPAQRPELESTEGALVLPGVVPTPCALDKLGVSVAFDDLGIGYSNPCICGLSTPTG
jgi:EAL domain-containing protein (putative c-di-GMP-specific phosphodiesterase class I)